MGTEENKKVAFAWLKGITECNIEGILNTVADDLDYWMAGNFSEFSPTKSKKEFAERIKVLPVFFPEGLKLTADNTMAVDDWVVVEGHSFGKTGPGKTYQNKYVWVFKVVDRKIQVLREYLDTLVVQETFLSQ